MKKSNMTCLSLAMALSALLAMEAEVGAVPFNLILSTPDIVSGFITVDYDADLDALTASGFALQIDDDGAGPRIDIDDGLFGLNARINDAGALTAGNLFIGGTVDSLGFNSGTLLTGTLDAFGFPDAGGDPLEFIFSVTGGDAAGLYGGTGGVILTGTGFEGSFRDDFSGPSFRSTANAAAAVVPEYGASVSLMLVSLVGLAIAGMRLHVGA